MALMSMWLSRSADAAALQPSTAPILDAATKFLWSDEMQESVDAFTRNYTPLFEGSQGPEGEQKLEWTDAHREFCELWEFHLESFVASQPFDAEQFLAACQDALSHGSWDNTRKTVEVVLSATDYSSFVCMMTAAAQRAAYGGSAEGWASAVRAACAEMEDEAAAGGAE